MEKAKILLVEDTESIREELRDILHFEGFEVITAENGQEGYECAINHLPDLILCDIMMPIKSGNECFEMLKRHDQLKNVPFIFLTAQATQNNVREGMNLGADDYITKPFNIDHIVNSINSRLKKASDRRESELKRRKTLQDNITRALPHELRTPLNGILGFSSLMMDHNAGFTHSQMIEFAEGIYESGCRLNDTIQKFLYHTEIELALFDEEKKKKLLNEFTDNGNLILEALSNSLAKKYNRLSDLEITTVSFSAKAAINHFEIIMENIVDNAFKFSIGGDKVKIGLTIDESAVNIFVIDKGVGFGNIKKNQIEAFSQFNRDKMEQQGLGLGLITAIKLTEFYGGDISWSNNSDKGTTVKITLLLA